MRQNSTQQLTLAINELYGLPNEVEAYLGHELINRPTQGIARQILNTIAWLGTEWKKAAYMEVATMSILVDNGAQLWLFFMKKKILPTQHDSTVPFEYVMLLYYIFMKQTFNLVHLMQGALWPW